VGTGGWNHEPGNFIPLATVPLAQVAAQVVHGSSALGQPGMHGRI
jgi:hypothetical protein